MTHQVIEWVADWLILPNKLAHTFKSTMRAEGVTAEQGLREVAEPRIRAGYYSVHGWWCLGHK